MFAAFLWVAAVRRFVLIKSLSGCAIRRMPLSQRFAASGLVPERREAIASTQPRHPAASHESGSSLPWGFEGFKNAPHWDVLLASTFDGVP
jgi:hypothetical protein